ncbi:MAG: DUF3570 domain-containing protein [Deltaproteobacteria bacterium]|nr:DUF3570 domain-containing protein [Deltaproteobacteria bacterium]
MSALVAAGTAGASSARADEATGRWTGHVGARGNYYYERSTRVMAPRADVQLESPTGTRIDADYLVDTITSASVATGVTDDVSFTEVRHEVGMGLSQPFDLAGDELRIGATGRLSLEPDYDSFDAGVLVRLDLANRATVLEMGLGYRHDAVRRSVRMLALSGRLQEVERACSDDPAIDCGLDVLSASATWTQSLNRTMELRLGYDLSFLRGFQWNPYRMVPVNGVPTPEHHPDTRFRNGFTARLIWHVPSSRTSLQIMPRVYVDSWELAAFSGELRIYQEVEPVLFRLRYRYYAQTDAYFYRPAAAIPMGTRYVTADPKMEAFSGHTIGGSIELAMPFLEGTFLDFARRATIDVVFDYTFQDSSFGNAAHAQIGGRIPF